MSAKLAFYHYPKCTTCQKARAWLEARGINYEPIDITQQPPSENELRAAMDQGGLSLRQLFNTSGQLYRQMNLKERLPGMSEAEAIEVLTNNGKLCKRPFVTDGGRFTVGFKESQFAERWGK